MKSIRRQIETMAWNKTSRQLCGITSAYEGNSSYRTFDEMRADVERTVWSGIYHNINLYIRRLYDAYYIR
jgi:hypothetical protein